MADMDPPPRPQKVPRRTPKACKQCRTAKIKCSGSHPCERCTRRRDTCVFPTDEPHVSIPERYLRDLERRVGNGQQPSPPRTADSDSAPSRDTPTRQSLAEYPRTPTQRTGSQPQIQESKFQSDLQRLPSSRSALSPQNAHARVQSNASIQSFDPALTNAANDSEPLPHNPLVGAASSSWMRDPHGRPRYLGPTSTWSFCRRALAVLEANSPSSDGSQAPLNLDGAAFRLRWEPKPLIDRSDLRNLPAMDYALYLYNTVKFHLAELCSMIHEKHFMEQFELFQSNPLDTACNNRLWFIQYLFVIAFGKAFLAQRGQGALASSPGSEFAARAMALLPDVSQLHDASLLAIEVLTLVALYFQSIDQRVVAYSFIGQALRFCSVEGINRQIPDDVIDPDFATRCTNLWWIVYNLDRDFSALMGSPTSIVDEACTVVLPTERASTLAAKALTLRTRLSRVSSSTTNTVYSFDENMSKSFVANTTVILHQLADVSQALDDTVSSLSYMTKSDLPHMFRQLMLSYHHCIVLTTRPLVMWLLLHSIPPTPTAPNQLAAPIAALVQTSAESAMTITSSLSTLAEHDQVEAFLPFELEYAFASAMLLCILSALLPDYVPDHTWSRKSRFVLDKMIKKRNMVAQLRKSELDQLEALLTPFRRDGSGTVPPVDGAGDVPQMSQFVPGQFSDNIPSDVFDTTLASVSLGEDFMANDPTLAWDALAGNSEQMLNLAEQFEMGDLDSSFFFEPV